MFLAVSRPKFFLRSTSPPHHTRDATQKSNNVLPGWVHVAKTERIKEKIMYNFEEEEKNLANEAENWIH